MNEFERNILTALKSIAKSAEVMAEAAKAQQELLGQMKPMLDSCTEIMAELTPMYRELAKEALKDLS
jgi:hypothetical protein